MRVYNNVDLDRCSGKTNFQNTKETRVFLNAFERQNNELRTLQAPENSFEHDYYFLSSELRQHQLAETNELPLLWGQASLTVDEKGSTKINFNIFARRLLREKTKISYNI